MNVKAMEKECYSVYTEAQSLVVTPEIKSRDHARTEGCLERPCDDLCIR